MKTAKAHNMQLTGQLDLLTPPPPKLPAQMHSETSKAAAKRERRRQAGFRWEVLRAFPNRGGWTDNELYALFPNAKQGTVRARRIGLVAEGFLMNGGVRRNGCTEWVITEKGREAIARNG
jgi:hypothetical protein